MLGRASSGDGEVVVEVLPGGGLHEVRLGANALRMNVDALAQEILGLAGRAERTAGTRLHHGVGGVLSPAALRELDDCGIARAEVGDEDDDELGPLLRRPQ